MAGQRCGDRLHVLCRQLLPDVDMRRLESSACRALEASGTKALLLKRPPLDSGRFVGKTAVVTGGGSGLGAAICRMLASEGACVVVADVSERAAQQIASEIPGGVAVCTDVTKNEEVESLMAAASQLQRGCVDIVINNAGITGAQVPLHKHPIDNFHHVMAVDCFGAFYTLRAALAQMILQTPTGGVVVNMASTAGLTGIGNDIPAYQIAKAGLVALTKTTAVHYAHKGIRVVCVAPSVTKTPLVEDFLKSAPEATQKAMLSMNPQPGMVEPVDVANAVAFLCSDEARWISGHTLPVDGAFVATTMAPIRPIK